MNHLKIGQQVAFKKKKRQEVFFLNQPALL